MLALLQQTALSVPHGLLPSHRGSLQHAETSSSLSASGQTLQNASLPGEVLFVAGRGRVSLKAKAGYYSLYPSSSRNIPIEKEDQAFLQPLLRTDTVNSFYFDVRASTT